MAVIILIEQFKEADDNRTSIVTSLSYVVIALSITNIVGLIVCLLKTNRKTVPKKKVQFSTRCDYADDALYSEARTPDEIRLLKTDTWN